MLFVSAPSTPLRGHKRRVDDTVVTDGDAAVADEDAAIDESSDAM